MNETYQTPPKLPFDTISFVPAGSTSTKTSNPIQKDIKDPSHPANLYSSSISPSNNTTSQACESLRRELRMKRQNLNSAFKMLINYKFPESSEEMIGLVDSTTLLNLCQYTSDTSEDEQDSGVDEMEGVEELYYCDICKVNVSANDFNNGPHETHLPHLITFEEYKKSQGIQDDYKPPLVYGVKPDNIGFQLLVKDGWEHSTGLGPSQSGRPLPIATRVKLDRRGLGMKPVSKKKINHTDDEVKYARQFSSGGKGDGRIVKMYGKREVVEMNRQNEISRKHLLKYLKDD
ncbi:G patch domain and ankyrin repeat-containing protein 1 [Nowakowskiella sp. JEL0407]|nr:G patch domain and ankyrin repeat-containing protein 1 [Nowakowskiella sp. JEL0407]